MRALYKYEIARRAGVSVNTLMSWCKPFQRELEQMGMKPNAKKLSPTIVKFLNDKLDLDLW
jgi:transposase-like protein